MSRRTSSATVSPMARSTCSGWRLRSAPPVTPGQVSGTSEAANAGEVDADRDRVRLREFHGGTGPRVDVFAVLLQPRGVVRHRRVVVQDLGGAGEYDDVAAAAVAVAVEVQRDQRLPPDVREPFGLRPVVGQQAVAAVPEKPEDRKSTRLNSSHQIISYAVFCLKKKNRETLAPTIQIYNYQRSGESVL